jgi:hypothetical protein
MIINNTRNANSFLKEISLRLTCNDKYEITDENDNVIVYFGAGYWRGYLYGIHNDILSWEEWLENPFIKGIRLVNPQESSREKQTEEAIAFLCKFTIN